MGKYIIRIEAMDGEGKELRDTYGEGIECDGFCIIGDLPDRRKVAIHGMSIDMLSDAIRSSDQLLSAGILAKAKKDITDMNVKRSGADALRKLFEHMANDD